MGEGEGGLTGVGVHGRVEHLEVITKNALSYLIWSAGVIGVTPRVSTLGSASSVII